MALINCRSYVNKHEGATLYAHSVEKDASAPPQLKGTL